MNRTIRVLIMLSVIMVVAACSQESIADRQESITGDRIQLEALDMTNDMNLYEAIETRVAARQFIDREISLEQVSKLLWAAHGVTYTEGEKTVHGLDAVSAATEVPRYTINPAAYDRNIKIYYIGESGAYEYIPEERVLVKITDENLLNEGTRSGENKQFRMLLTLGEDYKNDEKWGYLTVGSSIQNVNLVANTEGIHVLSEGYFDREGLADALELDENEEQVVLLSFGYIE